MKRNNKKGKPRDDKIPIPDIKDETIKFSFKYYDTDTNKYCISNWNTSDILRTLVRFQEINKKTYLDMYRDKFVYNFHPVDWAQTTKKDGFPTENANQIDPYQFSILGVNNGKARVFGCFANNIFYIVWFDYNHEIWPSPLKHT